MVDQRCLDELARCHSLYRQSGLVGLQYELAVQGQQIGRFTFQRSRNDMVVLAVHDTQPGLPVRDLRHRSHSQWYQQQKLMVAAQHLLVHLGLDVAFGFEEHMLGDGAAQQTAAAERQQKT